MRLDDIHPAIYFALFIVLLFAGVFAGVFAGANMLGARSCHARWDHSGLPVQHSFFSGCMVQRKDGTWVPSSTIRELTP